MIKSRLLTSLGVRHGYSTRMQKREDFLKELNVERITLGQQVHGVNIARVVETGKILSGIDGLVSHGLPLGVTFADCVPILAVDPKAKIIGTAHAGWKGTLLGIAKELILAMHTAGANTNNLYVSVGPHIGMCCYNVQEERAMLFEKKFGKNDGVISKNNGVWYADIGFANYQLLLDVGVDKDHIDAPVMCTSCRVDRFNSFRKDPKERFGVQLGVIAL